MRYAYRPGRAVLGVAGLGGGHWPGEVVARGGGHLSALWTDAEEPPGLCPSAPTGGAAHTPVSQLPRELCPGTTQHSPAIRARDDHCYQTPNNVYYKQQNNTDLMLIMTKGTRLGHICSD